MRRGWGHALTAAPTPPAWTPADLGARLALWHDASMGVTLDGAGVSQWADLSGNGLHATQVTAASRPTVDPTGVNGMPALLFDGSNDFFASPVIWTGGASRSLFMVWRGAHPSPSSFVAYHSGGTSASNMFSLSCNNANDPILSSNVGIASGVPRDGTAILAEASYASGTGRLSRNAAAYVTANFTATTSGAAPRIGSFVTGGQYFNGHIAAMLGIEGLATSEEVGLIREYFRTRYTLW